MFIAFIIGSAVVYYTQKKYLKKPFGPWVVTIGIGFLMLLSEMAINQYDAFYSMNPKLKIKKRTNNNFKPPKSTSRKKAANSYRINFFEGTEYIAERIVSNESNLLKQSYNHDGKLINEISHTNGKPSGFCLIEETQERIDVNDNSKTQKHLACSMLLQQFYKNNPIKEGSLRTEKLAIDLSFTEKGKDLFQSQLTEQKKKCDEKDKTACKTAGEYLHYIKNRIPEYTNFHEKACLLGEYTSCGNAAVHLYKSDPKKADALDKKGCDNGAEHSCINIALGFESPHRDPKAIKFYKKVCNDNQKLGCVHLGIVESKKGNKNKAKALWEDSCRAKHGLACSHLGNYYLEAGNKIKAKEYFSLGCKFGYSEICFKI